MDADKVKSLKTAYDASPENIYLLAMLLEAMWAQGEVRQAYEYLREQQPALWPPDVDRRVAVEICLEIREHYKALSFIGGSSDPNMLLLKARALAALDMKVQALQAYQSAMEFNPTLEDPELSAELGIGFKKAEAPSDVPASPDVHDVNDESNEIERLLSIHRDNTIETDLQRLLVPDSSMVTFADVGGLDRVKKEIHRRIILPFLKPRLFERFRKRVGGGILLYGPPGCGKTLLARATAGECNARFFNVAISDILSMWAGESETRLHALFEKARNDAPSVIFFDEIEALGGKRQYSHDAVSAKLVSQFLSEMDGFAQNNKGVLILAATNVPWNVDPAFRRPGRFDRVLFVPPPDREARKVVLGILLRERPGAESVDCSSLAAKTSAFSGADLGQLIETGADLAIEASIQTGNEVPLSTALLLEALKEVKPTTLEWLTTARNYARYANEAGHYDEVLEFLNKHGKD